MFLESENATNVTKEGTSTEPAKTAENVTAAAAPGELAGGAGASSSETPVSYPDHHHDVAQIDGFEPRVVAVLESPAGHAVLIKLVENFVGQWLFANPPTIGIAQMEQLTDHAGIVANETVQGAMRQLVEVDLPKQFDNLKADILAHLTPMITAITSAPRAVPSAPAISVAAVHELAVGDPVKVWADLERKTFLDGEIVAVHDGAHAFDVKLADGSVTKVGADGLEYDDRR